jgi:hypothetical protein
MDGQRFDEMTRRLAFGASRRTVVRGLAGGVFGLAASCIGVRSVAGQGTGQPGDPCQADEDCSSPGICLNDQCAVCDPNDNYGCAQNETCVVDEDNPNGVCQTVDLCADVTCGDCEACDPGSGECGTLCNQCQACEGGTCVDDCGPCDVCNLDTGSCDFDCNKDAGSCCNTDETCNADTGVCEQTVVACTNDADCEPCQSCTDGACLPRCSECESCDTSTDEAGVCFHDCRILGTACACGAGQICNEETGACESTAECAVDTDCDPCYACMSGVCTWLCGTACAACDETSGDHGTCLFDCRAGEGNACCDTAHGQVCNQQTGQCELDQSQFGTLVIKKVDDQGNPLTGACFDLLNAQTGEVLTSQPHCDGGFGDFDGTSNGTVVFQGNVRGSFGVRESVVPDGYVGAADQTTPQIEAGQTVEITFVNTPIGTGGNETGGNETGGDETGGAEETAATTLPTTGSGQPGRDGTAWLTGVAFIGAAAALLGGKKLREDDGA